MLKKERNFRLETEHHQYVEQYDLGAVCSDALYTISALLLSNSNCRQCTRGYVGLQLTVVTAGNYAVEACSNVSVVFTPSVWPIK